MFDPITRVSNGVFLVRCYRVGRRVAQVGADVAQDLRGAAQLLWCVAQDPGWGAQVEANVAQPSGLFAQVRTITAQLSR